MSVSYHMSGGDLPGLARLRELMNNASQNVLVGVPEGNGAGTKKDHDGNLTEASLAAVAATHEFGDPERNIPERSYLRAGVHEGEEKFHKLNEANLRAVVQGRKTIEESLDMLGVVAAGEVKQKIRNGPFVPLKPATIARKGSSKPLIDSAQLIQGITSVREGKQSANARVIR